jgi:hypothetical protein
MNKKELIEKIEALPAENYKYRPWIDKKLVLGLVRQLDEPQKPVVPQFVADWIEEVKPAYTLFAAMEYGNLKIDKWLGNNSNQETFALAWIFGYEVEKEKKYRVVMPNISSSGGVLTRIKHDDSWIWIDTLGTIIEGRTHTRKKLEDAGFGWVFDCPGIEVREVEE